MPYQSSTDAFVELAKAAPPGLTWGDLVGRTISFGGTFRWTEEISTGTKPGFRVIATVSGSTVNIKDARATTGAPGVYEIRGSFVVPEGMTNINFIRAYSSQQAPGVDVFVDDVFVVVDDYPGDYFDGDTRPGFTRWLGTPHASQSEVFKAVPTT